MNGKEGKRMTLEEIPVTTIHGESTTFGELADGRLERVLRCQANAAPAIFSSFTVARDALAWDNRFTYRLAAHQATWQVSPREQYRRYFRASGAYRIEPLPEGRTRRSIA